MRSGCRKDFALRLATTTPYTLHFTPNTLHLHPTPYTAHPTPHMIPFWDPDPLAADQGEFIWVLQGYLAHEKPPPPLRLPPPLGSPQAPRHGRTVGSYGVAVSYKQGTPVDPTLNRFYLVKCPFEVFLVENQKYNPRKNKTALMPRQT